MSESRSAQTRVRASGRRGRNVAQPPHASPETAEADPAPADTVAAIQPPPFALDPSLKIVGEAVQGVTSVAAAASVVELTAGLHIVEIAGPSVPFDAAENVPLPLIRVAEWPTANEERLLIVSDSGTGEFWLEHAGSVIVRAPPRGGRLIVTVLGPADWVPEPAHLTVRHVVEHHGDGRSDPPPAARLAHDPREANVPIAILVHMERVGDRVVSGEGWVGTRGQNRRIEGISIKSLGNLRPEDIRYMALYPGGEQTPWVSGAEFCGTRGRGVPLVGFAVALAQRVQDRYDVIYQGAFFGSGVTRPASNGQLCRPPLANDPLEAINVRIVERTRR